MIKITMYSKSVCPYCIKAKLLLKSKGVENIEEISLDKRPDLKSEMVEKSNGRVTVPQIFMDEEHIGGFDDLAALNQSGELDKILNS